MSESLKLVYKILKKLDNSMDDLCVVPEDFTDKAFNVSYARWLKTIRLLLEANYITGFEYKKGVNGDEDTVIVIEPSITLQGMQYLAENSAMATFQKIMDKASPIICTASGIIQGGIIK